MMFYTQLSAPPSWLTASMNLWCNSGVHFNLGFASLDKTKFISLLCTFCTAILVCDLICFGFKNVAAVVVFIIGELLGCLKFSLTPYLETLLGLCWKEYMPWERKRELWPPLSLSLSLYHFPFISNFLYFLFPSVCVFYLSFFFDLKGRRESIVMMQQKQRKQHTSIFALSQKKRKNKRKRKVYGLFLFCCFPLLNLVKSLRFPNQIFLQNFCFHKKFNGKNQYIKIHIFGIYI